MSGRFAFQPADCRRLWVPVQAQFMMVRFPFFPLRAPRSHTLQPRLSLVPRHFRQTGVHLQEPRVAPHRFHAVGGPAVLRRQHPRLELVVALLAVLCLAEALLVAEEQATRSSRRAGQGEANQPRTTLPLSRSCSKATWFPSSGASSAREHHGRKSQSTTCLCKSQVPTSMPVVRALCSSEKAVAEGQVGRVCWAT